MPTEEFEEGKLYFKDENGEYKELAIGTIEDISISEEQQEDFHKFESPTHEHSFEFEIENKNVIRKIKRLMKKDKDIKAEQRYNKESFRKFIKGRR